MIVYGLILLFKYNILIHTYRKVHVISIPCRIFKNGTHLCNQIPDQQTSAVVQKPYAPYQSLTSHKGNHHPDL